MNPVLAALKLFLIRNFFAFSLIAFYTQKYYHILFIFYAIALDRVLFLAYSDLYPTPPGYVK
jgi:hypothetical protein